jgi:hypothetical protein
VPRPMAILAILALLATVACAPPRPDPRVQAAQDFQRTALELVERDNAQTRRLNALRLGMSDEEVLHAAGPPTRRQTLSAFGESPREIWTYGGELKELGTLTFEDGRLVQLKVN